MWRASRSSVRTRRLCVCVPLVVACLGCPREGASLWRVWGVHARGPRCGVFGVSTRGGLVRAGCETQWLQSGVHKLSSVHVHQLKLCNQCGHVQGSCGAKTGQRCWIRSSRCHGAPGSGLPSASGEVLAAARVEREVVCDSLRCGEGVLDLSRTGLTVLVGRFHQVRQFVKG